MIFPQRSTRRDGGLLLVGPNKHQSIAMKVGQSARRARARDVSKESSFEEAIEHVEAICALPPSPIPSRAPTGI
jgi:hypothetical protein